MKRFLHLICLLAVAALLPAAMLVSRGLPADPHPYVEEKYAGWNGVLRAWVCSRWSCSGGFVRWLNARAAAFEKRHDGVYIEFTPVDEAALRTLGESGILPPELVLFSPGALDDPAALAELEAPAALRGELRGAGGGRAYPVAMGGYVWVYNRALTGGAPAPGEVAALPDDAGRSFSAAALALLSDPAGSAEGDAPECELPDAGLDLGLPAAASAAGSDPIAAEDALDRFIDGELPAVVASQAELARLIRLRDAGRGPDWDCAAAGQAAYTDQLLLLGLTGRTGDAAEERRALAEEFGASLLEQDAQAALADIGAFSVTGARIHSDLSAYAALDALLNGRALLIPSDLWSDPPSCVGALRALAAGTVAPDAALDALRAALN